MSEKIIIFGDEQVILYKYVKPDGIDIIKNLRIKVSSVLDFNDPFEWLPTIADVTPEHINVGVFNNEAYLHHIHSVALSEGRTNKSYELFIKEIKSPDGREKLLSKLADITKVLRKHCDYERMKSEEIALMTCFCAEPVVSQNEILMWSYYTDGHKGLRIGFDKNLLNMRGTSFVQIKYDSNRARLNPIDYWKDGVEKIGDVYDRAISTKGLAWEHEKEIRWLVFPSICQKEGANSFVYINRKAIVEISCGVRCSSEQIALIKELAHTKVGDEVRVQKAEIDNYEFKLKYSNAM